MLQSIIIGGMFILFIAFTAFCIYVTMQSKIKQTSTFIGKFIYYYGTVMTILLGVAFFSCFAGSCAYLAGKFLIQLLVTK